MGVKIGVSNIYMIQKSNKINAFCCFFIDFVEKLNYTCICQKCGVW